MHIEDLISAVPTELKDTVLSAISDGISINLDSTLAQVSGLIPSTISALSMMKFILIYGAAVLGMGVLTRLILGRQSDLTKAISVSVSILLIYVVTIMIYTFRPLQLDRFLSPLPFASFLGDYLFLAPLKGASFNALCSNILSMIVLAFLVNLADSLLPDSDSLVSWYFTRILLVILSMGLHLAANYAINAYLPIYIVTYAPSVLLVLLLSLLLLGIIKLILGIALTVVHPFLGAVYTFFFASHIGKQLSKAVLSTMILCIVLYVIEYAGFLVIAITPAALISYVPLLAVLLILWYLLGHQI